MTTADGSAVVDRHNSHIHDGVAEILPEALGRIRAGNRPFLVEEVKFDHVVGTTCCVRTGPDDSIVYARRPRRAGVTRFVKNRAVEPCDSVVIILKEADEGYVLITAFIGSLAEPEPWDAEARLRQLRRSPGTSTAALAEAEDKAKRSATFWAENALVWGSEPVEPGTETQICPW